MFVRARCLLQARAFLEAYSQGCAATVGAVVVTNLRSGAACAGLDTAEVSRQGKPSLGVAWTAVQCLKLCTLHAGNAVTPAAALHGEYSCAVLQAPAS